MKDFLRSIFLWLWTKKWRVLVVLIFLVAGGFWLWKKYFWKQDDTSIVSADYVVTTGDVGRTLNLAGTTQFANAQKLTFANKWRVTSVKTKIWAHVKKGDVLATITTDDLDRKVETAKKELKNKQLELRKVIDKSDKALELLKAQSNYDLLMVQKQTLPAEQQLDIQTKKAELLEVERLIKDKEKSLKEAEQDYAELLSGKAGANNAELSLSKNVRTRNTTMEKLIRAFREEASALQSSLDSYDNVMQLTDQYSSDNTNIYIGAKNLSLRLKSESYFWKIQSYKSQLDQLYHTYSSKPLGKITENDILSWYNVFKQLGVDLATWGKINYDMFLQSIETAGASSCARYGIWGVCSEWESDSSSLTKSTINSYAKTFWSAFESLGYAYQDKYHAAVETLAGLKDSDTTIEDAADKVEKLKIELENLNISLKKKKLDFDVNQKKLSVDTADLEKKIQDAKVDLEKARAWTTQQDELERIQNEIDNAQFELTTLMKQYDDYRIIANFDGIVTKLDMQVGDSIEANASADTQKYIYVETPDLLEVKMDVDQIDIVKIKQGMKVEVTVDAFPDQVYSGVFSEIDTMPEWNSYKAKVVFQKNNPEEKILGGMSANVKVTLEEEKGKLIVPNPALADNENWEKIVRLKKGNDRVDQVVEIGISDDSNTIILSGLKLGDTIKGFYMNGTSMANLGLTQGPSDGIDVTTNPDGSMSYQYGG